MKTGIQSSGTVHKIPGSCTDEDFRLIREAGFDAVDFNLDNYYSYWKQEDIDPENFFSRPLPELKEYFRPFKEACGKNGLIFSQMHAPMGISVTDKKQLKIITDAVNRSIEIAAWMGSPCIVVHPLALNSRYGRKIEWDTNISFFSSFIETAKRCDITVCLENMFENFGGHLTQAVCSDPAEAAEYIDALNREAGQECFGFCFDIGHAFLLGRDIYEFIRTLGKRIKILHLHDNDSERDLHNLPFVFTREYGPAMSDWSGFISGMRETGYSGVLSFETFDATLSFPKELCQDVRRLICSTGKYLSDMITAPVYQEERHAEPYVRVPYILPENKYGCIAEEENTARSLDRAEPDICIQTRGLIDEKDPLRSYEMIADAGFTSLDFGLDAYLSTTDVYNDRHGSLFDREGSEFEEWIVRHRDAVREARLVTNQVHAPFPVYREGFDRMNEFMKVVLIKSFVICRALGGRYLVIHPVKFEYQKGREYERRWNLDFYESLIPLAREYDTVICLENMFESRRLHRCESACCDALQTAEDIDYLNKAAGEERFGFCFDTGHAMLLGKNQHDFITDIGKRLKTVHIHENDGVNDMHRIPFSMRTRRNEDGIMYEWDSFMKGLKEVNYSGVMSFETAPALMNIPEELWPASLKYIAEIGKYMWKRTR